MNKTLGYLLSPDFATYRSIGELARTLQFLLSTAGSYRDRGNWGDSGPHETLVNYGGCVNCLNHNWHSSRINVGPVGLETTTWQENHDALRDCILGSLCAGGSAHKRWRTKHGISLDMQLRFPMAYQRQTDEQEAWKAFVSLHKFQLEAPTLNPCHLKVNILAEPQLVIGPEGILITCKVTDKYELRTSPRCYSRCSVCFLLRDTKWNKLPKWHCRKETFAEFVIRAVDFYKHAGGKEGVPLE